MPYDVQWDVHRWLNGYMSIMLYGVTIYIYNIYKTDKYLQEWTAITNFYITPFSQSNCCFSL